ncbi:MAG: fumarylacetoacetase [Acidobacteria bacterium]|nr:fumarylacetoacetase [Acidobacteriota bacterium]
MNPPNGPAPGSWVPGANEPGTDFPIQNLPFGVFRLANGPPRAGVAIGAEIVDLSAAHSAGLFRGVAGEAAAACTEGSLNRLMALGIEHAGALRDRLAELLSDRTFESRLRPALRPMSAAEMLLPAEIGDYTDFYASLHHATNVGSMFRPDNPLLPNYRWIPVAYHGRASSIVISGTAVKRPRGQIFEEAAGRPSFAPSRLLDYELEVGVFVGRGNALGQPVPVGRASQHIFGLCLVNDWSARDMQKWEYQPLGPFLAKNFATTISPWIVPWQALEPFRVPAFARPTADPEPLPHLYSAEDQGHGGIDLTLEVSLCSRSMREQSIAPARVSRGSFRDMYWTVAQMIAHHTSNGCNLRPGDLIASGTVSGAGRESSGCLLERTWRGTEPLQLPTGEERKFLEDGDEVIFRGYCERAGVARIGFGECRGIILSA